MGWEERAAGRRGESDVTATSPSNGMHCELCFLSTGEADGIPSGAVNSEDVWRKISSEGD